MAHSVFVRRIRSQSEPGPQPEPCQESEPGPQLEPDQETQILNNFQEKCQEFLGNALEEANKKVREAESALTKSREEAQQVQAEEKEGRKKRALSRVKQIEFLKNRLRLAEENNLEEAKQHQAKLAGLQEQNDSILRQIRVLRGQNKLLHGHLRNAHQDASEYKDRTDARLQATQQDLQKTTEKLSSANKIARLPEYLAQHRTMLLALTATGNGPPKWITTNEQKEWAAFVTDIWQKEGERRTLVMPDYIHFAHNRLKRAQERLAVVGQFVVTRLGVSMETILEP